jgi:hypothetical protein
VPLEWKPCEQNASRVIHCIEGVCLCTH